MVFLVGESLESLVPRHYTEGWLWVPSLAQPNPDFQFKLRAQPLFLARPGLSALVVV